MRYAPPVRPGDSVGVATPSGPGAPVAPRRFERGVRFLERCGFAVKVGGNSRATGHAAGSARARADELNRLLADPEVRAIVCTIGGYSSNALLPLLDYAAIARDPKAIIGYSDITALLLGIHERTGLVTFHGPTLMPELGEFPEPQPASWRELSRLMAGRDWAGPVSRIEESTEEFLLWDHDDIRPRELSACAAPTWFGHESVSGRLLGGNLETIETLAGTPFCPSFADAILFLETCETNIAVIERSLTHLDQAGLTDGIAALLVGRSFQTPGETAEGIRELFVQRYWRARRTPLVLDLDIGHTDPMLTLPVGHEAVLDFGRRQLVLCARPEASP